MKHYAETLWCKFRAWTRFGVVTTGQVGFSARPFRPECSFSAMVSELTVQTANWFLGFCGSVNRRRNRQDFRFVIFPL